MGVPGPLELMIILAMVMVPVLGTAALAMVLYALIKISRQPKANDLHPCPKCRAAVARWLETCPRCGALLKFEEDSQS